MRFIDPIFTTTPRCTYLTITDVPTEAIIDIKLTEEVEWQILQIAKEINENRNKRKSNDINSNTNYVPEQRIFNTTGSDQGINRKREEKEN